MKYKRRAVLALVGASTVAGCLGGGDGGNGSPQTDDSGGNSGGTDGDSGSDDAAADGEEPEEATVQVRSHPEFGEILVGPNEMTLYNFDNDTQGTSESTCYDDCADAWPALTVEDAPVTGPDVTAELTTLERDDGAMQVAANGWPLYYFASDEEPGDTAGQGINDVWWVLRPDGTPVRDNELDGETNGNDTADDDTAAEEDGDGDGGGGDDGPGGSY